MAGKLLNHPLAYALLILLAGILAYSNSFSVPFVLDDLESIVTNATIRDLGNFLPGGTGLDFHFRRWVAYFTFALNYRFGGYEVFGYHLVNLAIHLGTTLLVYALARLLFRTPHLAASRLAPQAGVAALFAALLFALHPVQTQAVTYVVQRLTSLCTFFYLLALVLYVRGRLEPAGSGARGWAYQAGAVLAAVLAMFTKEIAFTLPLAALLCEACFFEGSWRQRLPALLPLLLTLAIIPVLVLAGGELSAAGTLRQARLDIPRAHYLLTQLPVIVTYLRLLLLPVGQNIDYDYPVYTTPWTPPVILSGLLLLGILGGGLWLYRQSAAGRHEGDPALRLIAFGIFWFFLTLTVESGLVPLPDVIFEHRLYLPLAGLTIALAAALLLTASRPALALGVAAVLLAVLGTATWQRNQVWHSALSLWEDTARKSPAKVRPLYNYGSYLAEAGRIDEALPVLARVVELEPQHADAWHNLGRAYLLRGRTAEALPALRTAVRLAPEMDNALLNFTLALVRGGDYREAIDLLEERLRRPPDLPGFHANLGFAYAGIGDLPAARRELAILQRLDPALAQALAETIGR